MAKQALAVLENALRAHRLDRTLTTALAPLERADPSAFASSGVAALDVCLKRGFVRGQLSELVGARSSGRTLLLLQTLAAATRRGEIAALVDTFDCLDLASAVAARIDLDRLLWIRGHAIAGPQASGLRPEGGSRGEASDSPGSRGPSPVALVDHVVDRALKAFNLVLQAGGFGVVALDLADVPPSALARIPFTTWLRVQRAIEGTETACVLVASQPVARSAGGLTLSLAGRATWAGHSRPHASRPRAQSEATEACGPGPGACFLAGMDVTVRVVSPRRRVEGEVVFEATAANHGTASHRD
jgi:hypothetical protein